MSRTREQLLATAEARIVSIYADRPECRAAAAPTRKLLEQIVDDKQPTPQVVAAGGGIEVAWLVNGWHVGLIVTAEGEEAGWGLWAEQPDGTDLFEVTGEPDTPISVDLRMWTQRLLAELGRQVRY